MKLTGEEFENSKTCKGVGFAQAGAPVDLAYITIRGRYPEKGWAVNDSIHEIAWVEDGSGKLYVRGNPSQTLQRGDAVLVSPGERFAWEGNMNIVIACSPPFDAEQYKIEETEYEV